CATNILVITRRGRRVAQAALELCGSSERLGLMTLISSMSLNAERVACRTLTPWKSRQNKRRFQRSYRQARGKRLPAAQRDFSEPIRDADEQNTAGREEQ